jgi:hypothetical protein
VRGGIAQLFLNLSTRRVCVVSIRLRPPLPPALRRIISLILINNQLDALFYMNLLHFCTYFEQPSAHHQENQLYQYVIWYTSFILHVLLYQMAALFLYNFVLMFLCLYICFACLEMQNFIFFILYISDDVLIKLILLIMSTGLLEKCREVK